MGEPYDAEAEAEALWQAEQEDLERRYQVDLDQAYYAGREAGRRERDDALRARAEAAEAEAERLRHGLDDPRGPVEGDFVCPDGLALANLRQDLRALARRWKRYPDPTLLACGRELLDLLDREDT